MEAFFAASFPCPPRCNKRCNNSWHSWCSNASVEPLYFGCARAFGVFFGGFSPGNATGRYIHRNCCHDPRRKAGNQRQLCLCLGHVSICSWGCIVARAQPLCAELALHPSATAATFSTHGVVNDRSGPGQAGPAIMLASVACPRRGCWPRVSGGSCVRSRSGRDDIDLSQVDHAAWASGSICPSYMALAHSNADRSCHTASYIQVVSSAHSARAHPTFTRAAAACSHARSIVGSHLPRKAATR